MPQPLPNERKGDYIKRCVKYLMENEGLKNNQAVAMCYSYWENRKNKQEVSKMDDFSVKTRSGNSAMVAGQYDVFDAELDPTTLPDHLRARDNRVNPEFEAGEWDKVNPEINPESLPDHLRARDNRQANEFDTMFPTGETDGGDNAA
jgi:hypothetical protein